MPLIVCPDCGKKISDSASHCVHCGRPCGKTSKGKDIVPIKLNNVHEFFYGKYDGEGGGVGWMMLRFYTQDGLVLFKVVGDCPEPKPYPKGTLPPKCPIPCRYENNAQIACLGWDEVGKTYVLGFDNQWCWTFNFDKYPKLVLSYFDNPNAPPICLKASDALWFRNQKHYYFLADQEREKKDIIEEKSGKTFAWCEENDSRFQASQKIIDEYGILARRCME